MGLCERMRKIKRGITKKLVKSYVALFIAMFSSSYAITMMFPFAPFMVKFLLPYLDETDVGNYVGMLASAMFFGRFLASYVWGVVADHKGRKPVIIASSILLGLSSAFFGFSVHFGMAIFARFIVGVTNGVVGTAKAVVSEISDDSTQALGVSIISTSWGMGFVIGPAISGAISDPIGQYHLNITNSAIHSFLTRFPYSLPCLLNTLLCLVSSLITFLLLPETKGMKKNRRRSEINRSELESVASHHKEGEKEEREGEEGEKEEGGGVELDDGNEDDANDEVHQSLLRGSSEDMDNVMVEEKQTNKDDRLPRNTVLHTYNVFISNIGVREKDDSTSVSLNLSPVVEDKCVLVGREESGAFKRESNDTGRDRPSDRGDGGADGEGGGGGEAWRGRDKSVKVPWSAKVKNGLKTTLLDLKLFLCSRSSSLSLFIYCIFSFAVIGMDEVYSLWAFTSAHHGGLGFTLYQIGISLSVAGALMLPASLFVFPLLERYLGLVKSFYFSVCVCIVIAVLLPNLHYLVPFGLSWLLWVMLCGMRFIFMIFVSSSFASTILFINNSVTFDKLGAINGLAVSMTAITRTVAPLFAGSVFAASLSPSALAIGFPFNYNLVFVIFGTVFLATVVISTCLPSSINKQKIIEDVDASEREVDTREREVDSGEREDNSREREVDIRLLPDAECGVDEDRTALIEAENRV